MNSVHISEHDITELSDEIIDQVNGALIPAIIGAGAIIIIATAGGGYAWGSDLANH